MRGYGGGGPKETEKWDGDAGQEMAAQGGWPREVLRSAASAAARGHGVGGFSERARCGYNALIGLCPTEGLTGGCDFGAVCLRVLSLGACLHGLCRGNFCARQGKARWDALAGATSSGAQRLQRRPECWFTHRGAREGVAVKRI